MPLFFYAVHACALLCCALVTIIIIIMHGTKTQEEEEEEEREAKSKYAARMHALCIPSDPSRESTLLHYARKFALSFCAWAHILSHVRYVTEGSCSCASVFSTTTVTNVKCSSTTVPAAVKYMKWIRPPSPVRSESTITEKEKVGSPVRPIEARKASGYVVQHAPQISAEPTTRVTSCCATDSLATTNLY